MKKRAGIVILLITVFSLWLSAASAGEPISAWITDSEGNEYQCWQEGQWLYYYESEDGNPVLYQYNGSEATVTLPAGFDGKPVTKIWSRATEGIVNAIIPGEMAVLPEASFLQNTNLKSVTFESGVAEIGDYAFSECYSLEEVSFPDTLTHIGFKAFMDCTSLWEIFLPGSVLTIDPDCFLECTDLAHVWYDGSREAFAAISIAEEGNAAFQNAEKHYLVITAAIVEVPELIDLDGEGAEYTFRYALDGGAAPYALQYEVESFDSGESSLGVQEFSAEGLSAGGTLPLSGVDENAATVRVRIVSVQGASGRSAVSVESAPIPVRRAQILPDPVTIQFPEGETLVLGQDIEISWALQDGYSCENASIGFTERREDGNGNYWFRRQSFALTETSGTYRYTPEAGNTLTVGISFIIPGWGDSGYFFKNDTYSLTGTPAISLVIAESSLALNKEDCVMDFTYQLQGGVGDYQRLYYQIISEPVNSIDPFYPEGEILLPEASGTLTLATLLPGSYLLYMNIEDESDWNYSVNKTYTVSEADGSREIRIHMPATLYAQDEQQAVKWSLTGGYTPFYCNVALNFLDESGTALTAEPFLYADGQTAGETLLSLTEPMALTAVFTITTQDPDGPRGALITLDPIEVPITVEKAAEIVSIDVSGLTAFNLPEGLTEIGEEAFSEISAEYVLCPDSLVLIGENAFAGCENLICVSLPDSINASGIGAGAFPEGVIFLCEEGSSAWQWAEANHLMRMKR